LTTLGEFIVSRFASVKLTHQTEAFGSEVSILDDGHPVYVEVECCSRWEPVRFRLVFWSSVEMISSPGFGAELERRAERAEVGSEVERE
jgi:hypothetical protein